MFKFAETRSGENVREFLHQDGDSPWRGTLVTDGYSGYHATIERGVTAANCMAHARRKFHELWANHGSQVGEQALLDIQTQQGIEASVLHHGCGHGHEPQIVDVEQIGPLAHESFFEAAFDAA